MGNLSEGQSLEQTVFQMLHTEHQLEYYSKGSQLEIDFIVDKKVALEVKKHVSDMDILTLKQRSEAVGLSQYFVVAQEFTTKNAVILGIDV